MTVAGILFGWKYGYIRVSADKVEDVSLINEVNSPHQIRSTTNLDVHDNLILVIDDPELAYWLIKEQGLNNE